MHGLHVLVAGATGGIGRAVVRQVAALGGSVTLVARDQAKLQDLSEAITAAGGQARWESIDVSQADDINHAVGRAEQWHHLWGVVNCAGGNRVGPSASYLIEDFDALMAMNVRGAFLLCQSVGCFLLAGGQGGRIVNITSQMGLVGFPERAAYCAAKHAVNGLTKALGVEWASAGITVNAVAPTFIETDMTRSMLQDQTFRAEVLHRLPTGRLASPEDVAEATCFLLGPGASSITGHVLSVDGGWVAW